MTAAQRREHQWEDRGVPCNTSWRLCETCRVEHDLDAPAGSIGTCPGRPAADDDRDDAARDRARWAQQDAGLVPSWDAEERAVARRDAEDRANWQRRAS